MKKVKVVSSVVLLLLLTLSGFVFAAGLSLDDIINKIQSNQEKIKDMYAETNTTVVSSISIPGKSGTQNKGPQKMVQKGKMWSKGEDKTKVEIFSPNHQISITNGDKMAIINPDTGQEMIQDLKKLDEKTGLPSPSKKMGLAEAKKYFNLSVSQAGATPNSYYIIQGTPKNKNGLLGKMDFYIDPVKWVPVKVYMYDTKNNLISQSEMSYQNVAGIWVPQKNHSQIITPAGKMDVEINFSNIKVNSGINDREFKIK